MTTVHIENTVHDFDAWKSAFDRFERFRADHGVRHYRVTRSLAEPGLVTIDLDFDTRSEAEDFTVALTKIWATPQSRQHLIAHEDPVLLELVVDRVFAELASPPG